MLGRRLQCKGAEVAQVLETHEISCRSNRLVSRDARP